MRLTERDGALGFVVTDDGAGFDTARTRLGSGLQGMKDRLEALGGTLEVASTRGSGTRVDGTIPVRAPVRT